MQHTQIASTARLYMASCHAGYTLYTEAHGGV